MEKIYSKFGFDIVILYPEDYDEIFRVFSEELVPKRNISSMRRHQRILKGEINFTFDKPDYYVLGISENDTLVGACMCNESNDVPWVGHLSILRSHRKTKAFIVFLHYIINILFKDKVIEVGNANIHLYKKMIQTRNRNPDIAMFKPEIGSRVAKIINKG